eukprot:UN07174
MIALIEEYEHGKPLMGEKWTKPFKPKVISVRAWNAVEDKGFDVEILIENSRVDKCTYYHITKSWLGKKYLCQTSGTFPQQCSYKGFVGMAIKRTDNAYYILHVSCDDGYT